MAVLHTDILFPERIRILQADSGTGFYRVEELQPRVVMELLRTTRTTDLVVQMFRRLDPGSFFFYRVILEKWGGLGVGGGDGCLPNSSLALSFW